MPFQERRRGTRVTVTAGPELRLSRRVRVRLVDISGGGALVACDEGLPVGTTGRLRVGLGGGQFEALVEITREHTRGETPALFGAVIIGTDPENRATLEQFLNRATP